MKVKNQKGFGHIEILIGLILLACIALVGYRIIEHHNRRLLTSSSVGASSPIDIKTFKAPSSNLDAQALVSTIQESLSKSFPNVSSFVCNGMGPCGSLTANTIAISEASINGPARKVAGYSFYLSPELPGRDIAPGLEIDTQNSSITQAVLRDIHEEISINNVSTTTNQLNSVPESINPGYTTEVTFYVGSSICEVETEGAGSDAMPNGSIVNLLCSPMSNYASQAAELQPLYKAFGAAYPQFANPMTTGDWLEFYPNDSAYYSGYLVNGKTAGSQLATATVYEIYTKDSAKDSPNNGAWFYAENDDWHLLNYAAFNDIIPCNFSFPNSEAHQAFVGTTCSITGNGDTGTIQ